MQIRLLILAFAVLAILPLIQAVSLNDTYITNSGNNLTINITTQKFVDTLVVNPTSINFSGLRDSSSSVDKLWISLTESNKNYTGLDLPYFLTSTDTSKVIVSNISQNLSGSIQFDTGQPCSNVANIKFTSANGYTQAYINDFTSWLTGYDYTCSAGNIELEFTNLARGTNTFSLNAEFSDAELAPYCRSLTAGFTAFAGFFAIIVLALVFVFMYMSLYNRDLIPTMILTGVITLSLAGALLIMGVIMIAKLC